jgi:hypothetical protein
MKQIVTLLLLVTSTAAFAISWSYVLIENSKPSLRVKINESGRKFELGDYKCSIDDTLINNGAETRSLTCDLNETSKVITTASCTAIDGVTKKQNTGDLTFFTGKITHTVILHCE